MPKNTIEWDFGLFSVAYRYPYPLSAWFLSCFGSLSLPPLGSGMILVLFRWYIATPTRQRRDFSHGRWHIATHSAAAWFSPPYRWHIAALTRQRRDFSHGRWPIGNPARQSRCMATPYQPYPTYTTLCYDLCFNLSNNLNF